MPVDNQWKVQHDNDGNPVVIDDTLTALIAADPEKEETPRHLLDRVYAGAFDAWEVAHQHVLAEYQRLADPAALLPDVPKALRDAKDLILEHEQALNDSELTDLLSRLASSPPARIQRLVRTILNSEQPTADKVRQIHDLAKEQLSPATRPPEIPTITIADIQLVTWMAVQAGQSQVMHRHPL